MQRVKPNSRIQRTHEVLHRAFRELVFERRYDVISVRDISQRAGVGRSTFYEHFDSKEDLLRESIMRPLQVLADAVTDCSESDLGALAAHFRDHRHLASEFFRGRARRIMFETLTDLIDERLRGGGVHRVPTKPKGKIIAAFVAQGQLGVLEAWLSDPQPCNLTEIAKALQSLTTASLAYRMGF